MTLILKVNHEFNSDTRFSSDAVQWTQFKAAVNSNFYGASDGSFDKLNHRRPGFPPLRYRSSRFLRFAQSSGRLA